MGIKSNINKPEMNFELNKSEPSLKNVSNYFNKVNDIVSKNNHSIETIDLSDSIKNTNETEDESKDKAKADIFDPINDHYKQFGGRQGYLLENIEYYINDDTVKKIISSYYPEATEEDIELLFNKMSLMGCSYIAAINSLFQYYLSKDGGIEEFEEKFGYKILEEHEGTITSRSYIEYNYNYAFLDYFLWYAKNEKGFETIEEVYGNVEEELEVTGNDNEADDLLLKKTGMRGPTIPEVAKFYNTFAKFLSEKDINMTTRHYLKFDELFGYSVKDCLEEGNSMIIGADGFNLYLPYDEDNNGKLDDIAYEDVGAHAMSIVDVADDGRYIVSSWGEQYIYDSREDDTLVTMILSYS